METNVLLDILPADSAERFRPKAPMEFLPWTNAVNFTIDGRLFDPRFVPYMQELYQIDPRVLVVQKGSQVGMSAFSLGRVLWGADQLGQRWIYFLPTDDEMDDFVADRVEKVIAESDHLRSRMGKTDNRGLKNIGPGLIYFRGLWTKRRAKSVPADGLIFDEVDEHKPENIAFGEDRVLMSEFQKLWYLSVPSFTKYGINKMFLETDQSYYQHKCRSCGKWNCLDKDFEKNFIAIAEIQRKSRPSGMTHYRGCRWCGAQLDMSAGQWVAEQPDRDRPGYLISRLYTQVYPPDYPNAATFLMREWNAAQGDTIKLGRFMIAFRAQPYDGEGARINDELLQGLEEDYGFWTHGTGCIFGLDQGDRLHISIYHRRHDNRLQLVYCERTESWGRAEALFRQFGCYAGAGDGKPNRNDMKRLAAKFLGRLYVQDFGGTGLTTEAAAKRKGKDRRKAQKVLLYEGKTAVPWFTVDRTDSLDATVDFVEGARLVLPDRKKLAGKDLVNYEEYCENLMMLKSKIEDTPSGRRKIYLDKVPNHHGMGLNSARIAAYELDIRSPFSGIAPKFLDWGAPR